MRFFCFQRVARWRNVRTDPRCTPQGKNAFECLQGRRIIGFVFRKSSGRLPFQKSVNPFPSHSAWKSLERLLMFNSIQCMRTHAFCMSIRRLSWICQHQGTHKLLKALQQELRWRAAGFIYIHNLLRNENFQLWCNLSLHRYNSGCRLPGLFPTALAVLGSSWWPFRTVRELGHMDLTRWEGAVTVRRPCSAFC